MSQVSKSTRLAKASSHGVPHVSAQYHISQYEMRVLLGITYGLDDLLEVVLDEATGSWAGGGTQKPMGFSTMFDTNGILSRLL